MAAYVALIGTPHEMEHRSTPKPTFTAAARTVKDAIDKEFLADAKKFDGTAHDLFVVAKEEMTKIYALTDVGEKREWRVPFMGVIVVMRVERRR